MNKSKIFLGFLTLTFTVFSGSGFAYAEQAVDKSVIAVSRFDNSTGKPIDVGVGLADKLTLALEGIEKFTIVDRVRLEDTMKNLQLDLSGLVDSNKAKEVGKLLSLDYLVVGNLNQFSIKSSGVPLGSIFGAFTGQQGLNNVGVNTFEVKMSVAVSFIKAETGEVLIARGEAKKTGGGITFNVNKLSDGLTWGQLNQGVVGEAINEAIEKAVINLKAKMFLPKILKRTGETVFIDVGRSDQVLEGAVYQVFAYEDIGEGHKIENIIGEVKVTQVFDTASKATITQGTDKIEPGQLVRFKESVKGKKPKSNFNN